MPYRNESDDDGGGGGLRRFVITVSEIGRTGEGNGKVITGPPDGQPVTSAAPFFRNEICIMNYYR